MNMMTDRDIRAIENMARTGMSFDDLRKSFRQFPIEEVEKAYMKVRREIAGSGSSSEGIRVNCS